MRSGNDTKLRKVWPLASSSIKGGLDRSTWEVTLTPPLGQELTSEELDELRKRHEVITVRRERVSPKSRGDKWVQYTL